MLHDIELRFEIHDVVFIADHMGQCVTMGEIIKATVDIYPQASQVVYMVKKTGNAPATIAAYADDCFLSPSEAFKHLLASQEI